MRRERTHTFGLDSNLISAMIDLWLAWIIILLWLWRPFCRSNLSISFPSSLDCLRLLLLLLFCFQRPWHGYGAFFVHMHETTENIYKYMCVLCLLMYLGIFHIFNEHSVIVLVFCRCQRRHLPCLSLMLRWNVRLNGLATTTFNIKWEIKKTKETQR